MSKVDRSPGHLKKTVKVSSHRSADTPAAPQPAMADTDQHNTGRALLKELRQSGFIGMWKDRKDIDDSSSFARRLRDGIDVRADREDREESVS